MIATLAATGLLVMVLMVAVWLVSVAVRNASIADAFWGTGFVITAWAAWLMQSQTAARPLLLCLLTTIWGIRLSVFLLLRNWRHGEDRRYTAMREHHQSRFWWISLFTVFLLQGGILWFVSWPLQVAIVNSTGNLWRVWDAIGLLAWIVGFTFETVGDWQLSRFKADRTNDGKVFDRGLWRYTRHPNYFGDLCVWWGLYCIAVSEGAGWTIASPLVMTWLLVKVSGVQHQEKFVERRRPEYAAYQRRTNALLPWWPRRKPLDVSPNRFRIGG